MALAIDYAAADSVFDFAVRSRLLLLCLSFISNLIIPDHKASDVFIYKNEEKFHVLDHIIYTLFGGLIRWDANYFIHVAHYGYTKENTLAFFPLFPFVIRLLASLTYYFLSRFVTYGALLLLFSVLVNILLFVKCASLLYELTRKVMRDDVCAFYAAIIFCVNPASVFFSAPYSETLYSYLTFFTILNGFNGNLLTASLTSGLSSAARSNGTLNVGFVLYGFLMLFIKHFSLSPSYLFTFVILLIVFFLASLAPFCLFQLYAYVKFCTDVESDSAASSSWCTDTIPLAYSYVQSRYWNVGFLKYYEIKQVPNFLLAAPILYVILFACYKKIMGDRELLRKILNLNVIAEIRSGLPDTRKRLDYFVVVVHITLLTLFCVFCVHIQVSTRMLCSSSPFFYWVVADFLKKNFKVSSEKPGEKLHSDFARIFSYKKCIDCTKDNTKKSDIFCSKYVIHYWNILYSDHSSLEQFLLVSYCLCYFVIGTVLFSNFYPWT